MREDIRLMRRCLIIGIITALIVFGVLFGVSFASNVNKQCQAIADVAIALASGIFGSAITLWLNKIFDYKAKKHDLLVNYFFTAYKLNNVISNVQPFVKEISYEVIKRSYQEFDENRGLWTELSTLYKKLEFKKGDTDKELVDKLYDFYKKLMPILSMNVTECSLNVDNVSISNRAFSSNSDLFDIKSSTVKCCNAGQTGTNTCVEEQYWPKTQNGSMEMLQELENRLFGKITIAKRIFPNAQFIK